MYLELTVAINDDVLLKLYSFHFRVSTTRYWLWRTISSLETPLDSEFGCSVVKPMTQNCSALLNSIDFVVTGTGNCRILFSFGSILMKRKFYSMLRVPYQMIRHARRSCRLLQIVQGIDNAEMSTWNYGWLCAGASSIEIDANYERIFSTFRLGSHYVWRRVCFACNWWETSSKNKRQTISDDNDRRFFFLSKGRAMVTANESIDISRSWQTDARQKINQKFIMIWRWISG